MCPSSSVDWLKYEGSGGSFQTLCGGDSWLSLFTACALEAVVGPEKTQIAIRLRRETGNSLFSLYSFKSGCRWSLEIEK